MQRERVADDIYVFISDLYAQVVAALILTPEGAILFDTLFIPEETRAIKRFVEQRMATQVRYVINSHYHADHTAGTWLFEDAQVIAHSLCREALDKRGRESLERARLSSAALRETALVLPDLTFDAGVMTLNFGGKTLQLWNTPGHSRDSIVCHVKEDRVLLAADTVMALPFFVDGRYDDLLLSLRALRAGNYETIVQGHGDIVLRGEIDAKFKGDIAYLETLSQAVDQALLESTPDAALEAIDLERCGQSRVLLNGLGAQLHRQNVMALASQRRELARL